MKIYFFIKKSNFAIYDRPDWRFTKCRLHPSTLANVIGKDGISDFIKFVTANYIPQENVHLTGHPDVNMYEIEL